MEPDLEARASAVADTVFGVVGRAKRLDGESDLNFRVDTDSGERFVLKLHHPSTDVAELEMQNQILSHLREAQIGISAPVPVPSRSGSLIADADWGGDRRSTRLLTWVHGAPWAERTPTASQLEDLGRRLAELDDALSGFRHPADKRLEMLWRITAALDTALLSSAVDGEMRPLVDQVFADFATVTGPRLASLPQQVVHHDANENNLVVGDDDRVAGILDFGDVARVPRVTELAVACAYAVQGHEDPADAILPLVRGYDSRLPLAVEEVAVLVDLIKVRLAMSVTMSAHQLDLNPENTYLNVSQQGVRRALTLLSGLDAELLTFRIRDALGFEANPRARLVRQFFESGLADPAAPLTEIPPEGSDDGHCYGSVANGEIRGRGVVRVSRGLSVSSGAAVRSPLAGRVRATGDDWVVLEHKTPDDVAFWTVLSGLARPDLRVDELVRRAQPIGLTRATGAGSSGVLEVQLRTHLRDPGEGIQATVPADDFDVWRSVCLDPNFIVRDNEAGSTRPPIPDARIAQRRRSNFSRAMSISYSQPLHIVRGQGAHLFDRAGNRWLDLVNNVCHVGHSHPRVVEAGHRQAQLLNTNMRYLHQSVVEYSHRLVELLPDPLRVCFLVNSGSEANDLALRLARAHTGARDALVLDHAYHGNLTSQIDLSPYKFNRAGGHGRPDGTWVCQLPDAYRGPHRELPPSEQASAYARSVSEQLAAVASAGRRPAAFFVESLQSCGGQIVLPDGYLKETFDLARAAGAVTVADEVQVGLGRIGRHAWGFEMHGVVPDIVTMGKPLGNGHPLAAVVTTPEVARSFETGMEWFNTFGGNPVSSEVGIAVLDVLRDEELQANARVLGSSLKTELARVATEHPLVGDVRGEGLFIGIELSLEGRLPATAEAGRLKEAIKARGVLVSTDGPDDNVIKIKPPMALTASDCDQFVAAFDDALHEVERV